MVIVKITLNCKHPTAVETMWPANFFRLRICKFMISFQVLQDSIDSCYHKNHHQIRRKVADILMLRIGEARDENQRLVTWVWKDHLHQDIHEKLLGEVLLVGNRRFYHISHCFLNCSTFFNIVSCYNFRSIASMFDLLLLTAFILLLFIIIKAHVVNLNEFIRNQFLFFNIKFCSEICVSPIHFEFVSNKKH